MVKTLVQSLEKGMVTHSSLVGYKAVLSCLYNSLDRVALWANITVLEGTRSARSKSYNYIAKLLQTLGKIKSILQFPPFSYIESEAGDQGLFS